MSDTARKEKLAAAKKKVHISLGFFLLCYLRSRNNLEIPRNLTMFERIHNSVRPSVNSCSKFNIYVHAYDTDTEN